METNIMTRSHGVEEASDHVLDDDPGGHLVAIPSPAPATRKPLKSWKNRHLNGPTQAFTPQFYYTVGTQHLS